jgi:hypothetical protein
MASQANIKCHDGTRTVPLRTLSLAVLLSCATEGVYVCTTQPTMTAEPRLTGLHIECPATSRGEGPAPGLRCFFCDARLICSCCGTRQQDLSVDLRLHTVCNAPWVTFTVLQPPRRGASRASAAAPLGWCHVDSDRLPRVHSRDSSGRRNVGVTIVQAIAGDSSVGFGVHPPRTPVRIEARAAKKPP